MISNDIYDSHKILIVHCIYYVAIRNYYVVFVIFKGCKETHQVATPFQFRTVTFSLVFEAGGAFEAEDEADA